MKKLLGLLLALSLLISVFSSCAPASAPYGDSAAASDELTLYITENETWWRAAVENFERENEDASVNLQTFASEEELAAKQNTEISTGGGPDVILDGRYASSPGDMRKMAQSGKFLALDSYFENDESFDESDYYAAVLDYGVYDGTRYTVTPAFGIPGIAAAESKIAEYPVLDGDYSMLELFTALADESEALSSDPNAFAYMVYSWGINFSDYLTYSGLLQFDNVTGGYTLDKDDFKAFADYFKVINTGLSHTDEIMSKAYDFVNAYTKGTFLAAGIDPVATLPNAISGLNSVGDEARILLYPTFNGAGEYAVMSAFEMGINKNSKNPELAYKFIRSVMDGPALRIMDNGDNDFLCSYSVNRGVLSTYFGVLPSLEGLSAPGQAIMEDVEDTVTDALGKLTVCGSLSPDLRALIDECMRPYLDSTDSFDSCYQNLTNKLTIYLTE